jgi:hypothetical protein
MKAVAPREILIIVVRYTVTRQVVKRLYYRNSRTSTASCLVVMM